MVEVPDSTTRYIQSDSGKPTKDLFNWMRNISQQLTDILSGTGGGLFSSGLPCFSVHKNGTNQTGVASATTTQVTWSTELYDVGSHFASNVWMPPAGRISLKFAYVADGTIAASFNNVIITKNGATTIFRQAIFPCGGGTTVGIVSIDDAANGNDFYGAAAIIPTSAGTSTIRGAVSQTWFMGHWISP